MSYEVLGDVYRGPGTCPGSCWLDVGSILKGGILGRNLRCQFPKTDHLRPPYYLGNSCNSKIHFMSKLDSSTNQIEIYIHLKPNSSDNSKHDSRLGIFTLNYPSVERMQVANYHCHLHSSNHPANGLMNHIRLRSMHTLSDILILPRLSHHVFTRSRKVEPLSSHNCSPSWPLNCCLHLWYVPLVLHALSSHPASIIPNNIS